MDKIWTTINTDRDQIRQLGLLADIRRTGCAKDAESHGKLLPSDSNIGPSKEPEAQQNDTPIEKNSNGQCSFSPEELCSTLHITQESHGSILV